MGKFISHTYQNCSSHFIYNRSFQPQFPKASKVANAKFPEVCVYLIRVEVLNKLIETQRGCDLVNNERDTKFRSKIST